MENRTANLPFNLPNGHGDIANPDYETRHARFPNPRCVLPNHPTEGRAKRGGRSRTNEALREIHVNAVIRPEGAGQILLPCKLAKLQLTPLYSHSISAGFPSPADDYIEDRLDLNELLISNKPATFFLRVKGDSMLDAGIHHGDIIVVDRSLQAGHRSIVVAVVDGELTVKRLIIRNGHTELHAENPKYMPIRLQEGQELSIWGVVTSSVHQVK